MRSRWARRSAALLVLAFALVAVVLVSVASLSLSGEQQADKQLGRYQDRTDAGVLLGDLMPGDLDRAREAVGSAAPGSHLFLESTQIRPDSLTKRYVQAPLENLRFVEDPGLTSAFPSRYTLEEGSWPAESSEVVVTSQLAESLDGADDFTVLSGRVTLRVVGVVRDAYPERSETIVAAPGTWESIPRAAPGRQYQPVEASVVVLSDGSLDAVAHALERALPRSDVDPRTLARNRIDRSQVIDETDRADDAFDAGQFTISYVPLVLVALAVSAMVVGHSRGPRRDDADRLVTVGVRRRLVRLSQTATLTLVSSGAVLTGLVLGWLAALVLRATVLPLIAEQPLSPLRSPDAVVGVLAASSVLLVTAGSRLEATGTPAARWPRVAGWLADIQVPFLRRVIVVLLIVGAFRTSSDALSVTASYLAVTAALLASPDLLRIALRTLPRGRAQTLVVARLMDDDRVRQAAAVVVVAACVALPISIATQLVSKQASDASFAFSRVPAGQIWVQGTGGTGDVPGVARVVSGVEGIGRPIVVRGSDYDSDPAAGASSKAMFANIPDSGRSSSALMIIESADDVRRVVGGSLPDTTEPTLERGGVLDFTGAEGDQRFVVYAANGKLLLRTPLVPTLKVDVNQQFGASFGGAVLLETARALRLPVDPPTTYIYTDASPDVTADAVQAAVDAGYDSEFVQYAVPPPPPTVPLPTYVFLGALALGAFAVLLAAVGAQARRLRRYSARLVALGLRPAWARSVLLIQAGVTVGTGLATGVLGGVLGVRMSAGTYPVTDTPVAVIALACAATVIASALATLLAVRRLSAAEARPVN